MTAASVVIGRVIRALLVVDVAWLRLKVPPFNRSEN